MAPSPLSTAAFTGPTATEAAVATSVANALFKKCILKHFTLKQLDEMGLFTRPIDRDMRVELAEIDWEWFCGYYLPQHFNKPFAPMHLEMADDFDYALDQETPSHVVISYPRGHGKTTWISLALVLKCILFELRQFIILLAQEHSQAKDYLSDIRSELEDNERILEDFGDLRGQPWQATEIRTSTGIRIKPLGARMKLRGRKERHVRPDLIIADDLEDVVTAQNKAEREARKQWVLRTVLPAGGDRTVFFFVGNKVHADGVISMLLVNPLFVKREYKAIEQWPVNQDLWDRWKEILTANPARTEQAKEEAWSFYQAHQAAMDEGSVVAWPDGRPIYQLMLQLVTGGRAAFFAEMQNEPIDPSSRMFRYGTYRLASNEQGEAIIIPLTGHPAVKLNDCTFFAGVDPSLGYAKSDPSAIVVLARAPTGQMFVIVDDERRRSPYNIINDIHVHHKRFSLTRCGIESVQFQALFATDAAKESMQRGVYINFVQIPARSNKYLRISSLEPAMSMNYVLLPEYGANALREQLDSWPACATDDGLDALEICYRMAASFSAEATVQIIEGDSLLTGEGLFSPVEDPYYIEAEKLAHDREVVMALEAGHAPPEELWVPVMRY